MPASREHRDYRDTWGDRDGRNWFDRASETVAGWFSDETQSTMKAVLAQLAAKSK